LFNLRTDGGDEYCGHVIQSSINELQWDTASGNYKVIFIAGNEDFLQGDVLYTTACAEAKKKGVIVNTIYCGDRMQGIREHWNLNAECGNGSFTNINQNARIEDIPTPYDSVIFALNDKLNGTYINYGVAGYANVQLQAKMDVANLTMSKSAGIKRIKAKGQKQVYKNTSWDLVDLAEKDSTALAKIDRKTLPDSLQKKNAAELQAIVKVKTEERNTVQKEIATLNTQRESYIAAERKRNAAADKESTLETETEKIIKEQARRYNMVIQ
jgi:hypothetical protein